MLRRLSLLVCVLGACGPAVESNGETDSGAGSDPTENTGAAASSDTTEGSLECAPTLTHGSVPRSELASSLAAVLCIAQEDCCPDARPASSCRHSMNMGFEDLDDRAVDLGLDYDGECAGLQQAIVSDLGCEVMSPLDLQGLGACSVYFGDDDEGESCEAVGTLGSSCARGLACAAGSCVDPCTAESLGRPYVYGYACVPGEVPVGYECRSAASAGEACTGACAEGLYCAGPNASCAPACVGQCVWGEPLGSSCAVDGDCLEAVCLEGMCAVGQPDGAPCASGCGVGLGCDAGLGTCGATPTVCRSTAG